mgnify:CR=1 FL=1
MPRQWARLDWRLLWLAAAILLCLALSPLEAQQARRPFRIGVLNAAWAASHPTVEGLKAGLKELGFEDGRDVTFDIRFTEGKLDTMPAAAEALVKAGVDLIFTSQEAATQRREGRDEERAHRVHPGGRPGGRRHRRQARPARRQRDGCVEPPDRAGGEASGGPQDTRSGRPPGLAHLLQRRPGHHADDHQGARGGAAHEAGAAAERCARRRTS